MTFIPGEQGKKVKFWVEQGTKAILGNMEHRKTIFDSWGTGKQAYLFQGNKETVIPLGGSHKRSNFQTIHQFVCLFIRLSTRHTKLCLWSTDSMYVKTCLSYSSNIHCNVWPHTMINTTFAEKYAVEIYEVSLLSWTYSSSTHYICYKSHVSLIFMILKSAYIFFMKSVKM